MRWHLCFFWRESISSLTLSLSLILFFLSFSLSLSLFHVQIYRDSFPAAPQCVPSPTSVVQFEERALLQQQLQTQKQKQQQQ